MDIQPNKCTVYFKAFLLCKLNNVVLQMGTIYLTGYNGDSRWGMGVGGSIRYSMEHHIQ